MTKIPFKKQRSLSIHEELERRILHGLSCEWDLAVLELNATYREKLRKPLFGLHDMKSKWGYWSGEKREICLSRHLVLNHSWASVCEVLMHEIAHQFAEEVLGADNNPPHGPVFERACYLLRANPRASGNYRPLDEMLQEEMSNTKDKIMLRVKKLMALATSQNLHEANSAMAKAHELIAKHNVDLVVNEEKRHYISMFLGTPSLASSSPHARAGLLYLRRNWKNDSRGRDRKCRNRRLYFHPFGYAPWTKE